MQEKIEKMKHIEFLKQKLNRLIKEKDSLLDKEIIEVSKKLDSILNEYNELLKQEEKANNIESKG